MLNTVSTTSGEVLWPLGDHLGSVRDVVDSGGVIRRHMVHDGLAVHGSQDTEPQMNADKR